MTTRFVLIMLLTMMASVLVLTRLVLPWLSQETDPLILNFKERQIRVGETMLWVKLADDESEIIQGLSGVSDLRENEGMLFVLGQRRVPSFWMKDMKFPLDIIWIDNGRIIDITENVPTSSDQNLPTYSPRAPVTHVLEVNAGWVKQQMVEIGDSVVY